MVTIRFVHFVDIQQLITPLKKNIFQRDMVIDSASHWGLSVKILFRFAQI